MTAAGVTGARRAGAPGRLAAAVLALLAVLGTVQGCGRAGSGPGAAGSGRATAGSRRAPASYQGGGVRVTAALARSGHGERVEVTFTPDAAGFHLYSTALRVQQTHGLGVATRVTVAGGLRAAGPLTADRPVQMLRITVLHATLPVFPDGPVTLAVPVRAVGSRPASVIVTYVACSASVCLMPVIGHRIPLDAS